MDADDSEEHGLNLPSHSRSRSARTCVKNLKPNAYHDSVKNYTNINKSVKRKANIVDDDPLFSEVDDEDESSDNRKKVPGYRCSPQLILELMASLTEKQRGWVKKIQFDSFQDMIESRMPKSLTMWLVGRVDTTNGTLDVGGIPVDIRDSVARILKLPCGDLKVPPPLNGRSKAKRPKGDTSGIEHKYSDKGRGSTAKEATKLLLAEQEDEEEFCRSFVMLILCIYAAPTTSLNINRNYLPSLLDVPKIPFMDWCGFIADYLINGIIEYRESKASHVQVIGCVHILPLIYIDTLIRIKALKLPKALELQEGEPRIHFIGTQHLYMLASLDVKSRTKDHIEYGALMASCISLSGKAKISSKLESFRIGQKLSPVKPKFPSCCQNNKEFKDSAADIFADLFQELKDCREELIQDFKQRIELSDLNIFKKFHQRLISNSPIRSKSNSVDANLTENASPHPVEAEVYASPHRDIVVESITPSLAQPEASIPQVAPGTSKVSPLEALIDGFIDEKSNTLGNKEIPNTCPATNLEYSKPDATPGAELFETCYVNKGLASDITLNPIVDDHHEITESISTYHPSKIAFDSDNPSAIPGEEYEKYSDCMDDVVDIGAAAAHEATCNQQTDVANNVNHPPLLVLSEAALLHGSPLYDQPLVVPRHRTSRMDSFQYAPASTSTLGNPTSPFKGFPGQSPGPALFDKSPAQVSYNPLIMPTANSEIDHSVRLAVSEVVRDQKIEQSLVLSSQMAESYRTLSSESNNKTLSDEVSLGKSDESMDADEIHISSCDTHTFSQSYTLGTQELVEIHDEPYPPPNDIIHIPPLQNELPGGARFKFGGSVSVHTNKMYEKFKQFQHNCPDVPDIANSMFILSKEATKTYKDHVVNSSAKVSPRFRNVWNANRQTSIVQIKGFHITKGEFVDALKPIGEVCQTLMGLCSVAIMCDWDSKSKIILNQATIVELMKPGHVCEQDIIASRLRKFAIDEIEEIYLPILSEFHWFLAVVNVVTEKVEFYDSLIVIQGSAHPHKKLWENLSSNLEQAYCLARKGTVRISFFQCHYTNLSVQANNHDCGYHVIRAIECDNTVDVVGYSKNKTMMPYRRYLSHVLIYHRFNDLNPLRPHLCPQIP